MDQDPQRGALMSKQSPRVKSVRRQSWFPTFARWKWRDFSGVMLAERKPEWRGTNGCGGYRPQGGSWHCYNRKSHVGELERRASLRKIKP